MPGPEAELEKKVCMYAREKYNMLTRKLDGTLAAGWPDRMVLTDQGYICFIEFKKPGEPPALHPMQERMIRKLVTYGFEVYIINDLEQGKRLVDYISDVDLIKRVIHGHDPINAPPQLIVPPSVSATRNRPRSGPQAGDAVAGHGPRQDGDNADGDS